MIEIGPGAGWGGDPFLRGRRRLRGVVSGHLQASTPGQLPGDPFHLGMSPCAGGEVFELSSRIALVEAGDARREIAIALAAGAMAGCAGTLRARRSAAEGDQLSRCLERIAGSLRGAASRRYCRERRAQKNRAKGHAILEAAGPTRSSRTIPFAAAMLMTAGLAACKPPPDDRQDYEAAQIERGRALVIASGCTACHAFPDIAWPRGRAGPSLVDFDGRGPIAGALPNTPGNLAAFVRNAPLAKPGSTMPAMPLNQAEARDVAAYLHGSRQ